MDPVKKWGREEEAGSVTGHGLISQGVQAREEDKDSVRERRPRDKMGLDEGDWDSG